MPFGLRPFAGNNNNNNIKTDPTPATTMPAVNSHENSLEMNLRAELANLKVLLARKEECIVKLSQENHKLRSVLSQQQPDSIIATSHEIDSKAASPGMVVTGMPAEENMQYSFSLNPINKIEFKPMVSGMEEMTINSEQHKTSTPSLSVDSDGLGPLPQFLPTSATLIQKRQGVSSEPSIQPSSQTTELKYFEKDTQSRNVIRQALRENDFLKNMDAVQLQEMVSCMREKEVPEGSYLIREGEDGRELYVGAEGEYEVWKENKYLCTMGPGRCFGELALLYDCKRTASVRAVHTAKVWVLDRAVFKVIMMKTGMEMMAERQKFLSSVPLLRGVSKTQFMRIADVLEAQFHSPGDCIIRKDELADSFFIIQSGEVRVTTPCDDKEVEIRKLGKGQYFGEKALLSEGRRTANVYALAPGVDVLCLYRKDFLELIGNIPELKEKEYPDEQSLVRQNSSLPPNQHVLPTVQLEWSDAQMTDLLKPQLVGVGVGDISLKPPVVGYVHPPKLKAPVDVKFNPDEYKCVAILGVGGFGRVELVHLIKDTGKSFAMKRMRKSHIVKTRQQDHVLSEKRILLSIEHPFICKLYATARDTRFVYLLMEVCLGGELWTLLRDLTYLTDRHVRFSLACVIEAFDYLHSHGIVYRDLKPENLVIANRGYIKMCDFGFAKYIGVGSKTWTFCGTPEYVAPEVILNKGHDFAADYWSLGILTCELLTGTPPFQASEPIRIYMKTIKGIDALDLGHHKCVSAKAYHFIKKLCRANPAERIGVGRNGLQEIRNHKYFQGFDWEGVLKQTMVSPLKYKVTGALDVSNFDRFPISDIHASIEESGWDRSF